MSKIKLIIWDFDGVILLSNPVREKGFRVIFQSYPEELIEELLNYHRENGGLSRYVKIRYFYEKLLKQEIGDEQVINLANQFSEVMRKELTNPKLLNPEWLELMDSISNKYEHHIASGSDQNELRFLCKELGVAQHFKSINGSPTSKKELVKNIKLQSSLKPEEIILVGDAINDYEAAFESQISFFAYNNLSLKSEHQYLDDLRSLQDCI